MVDLSKSDFLKLRPPSLRYHNYRLKSAGTTKPRYASPPQSIAPWEGFKAGVNGTIWDGTPKYSQPMFQDRGLCFKEESIRHKLYGNVLLPFNNLLASDEAGEVFDYPTEGTFGEPDFIQHLNGELRLAIEVKTKWALAASDLVKAYTQNLIDIHEGKTKLSEPAVYHHVCQIFGYLSHNELRYGVLTTYDKTWFLYRENCCLYISPPIQHDDLQPTLFQCLFYLISLARDNHRCSAAPSSNPSNGEEECTPLEFFDWGSFSTVSVLGEGRTGTVFKAILHGEMVALKICDLWKHPDYEEELLNEVEVYHALKDLQGNCIPRFKGAGYTAGGLFAIATEIVGSPLEDVSSLSGEEHLVIQTALSSIHDHGFVHNDIRKGNILIKRNGSQFSAFFIDFAFSKPGDQHNFQNEMELLEALSDSLSEGSDD